MKWSLPILPVWLLVGLVINAYMGSAVFEANTGGNMNTWLYLTSFAYDRDLLALGLETSSAMLVMGIKYMLIVLIALTSIYTIGKNIHNGVIFGIEVFLSKRESQEKETVKG